MCSPTGKTAVLVAVGWRGLERGGGPALHVTPPAAGCHRLISGCLHGRIIARTAELRAKTMVLTSAAKEPQRKLALGDHINWSVNANNAQTKIKSWHCTPVSKFTREESTMPPPFYLLHTLHTSISFHRLFMAVLHFEDGLSEGELDVLRGWSSPVRSVTYKKRQCLQQIVDDV